MAINGVGSWIREQEGEDMKWARTLAYITGTVDQELLLRNEYLVAENRILKAQLKERLRLSDAERAKLGEIGHRLGRKALGEEAVGSRAGQERQEIATVPVIPHVFVCTVSAESPAAN